MIRPEHLYPRLVAGDRRAAAQAIRLARLSAPYDAIDLLTWARCAQPDSFPLLRREVALLDEIGEHEACDALIARGLLRRPNDTTLLFYCARRHFASGRTLEALDTVELILQKRAHNGASLLCARCLIELNRVDEAIAILHAIRVRTESMQTDRLRLLIRGYLRKGDTASARSYIHMLGEADSSLLAELLACEGRELDACLMLEVVVNAGCADADCYARWIELLGQVGEVSRLLDLVDVSASLPEGALPELAIQLLRQGQFELVDRVSDTLVTSREAGAILQLCRVCGLVIRGNTSEAQAVFEAHALRIRTLSRTTVARCWRAALIGGTIRNVIFGPASRALDERPIAQLLRAAEHALASNGGGSPIEVTCLQSIRFALGMPQQPPAQRLSWPLTAPQADPQSGPSNDRRCAA